MSFYSGPQWRCTPPLAKGWDTCLYGPKQVMGHFLFTCVIFSSSLSFISSLKAKYFQKWVHHIRLKTNKIIQVFRGVCM